MYSFNAFLNTMWIVFFSFSLLSLSLPSLQHLNEQAIEQVAWMRRKINNFTQEEGHFNLQAYILTYFSSSSSLSLSNLFSLASLRVCNFTTIFIFYQCLVSHCVCMLMDWMVSLPSSHILSAYNWHPMLILCVCVCVSVSQSVYFI